MNAPFYLFDPVSPLDTTLPPADKEACARIAEGLKELCEKYPIPIRTPRTMHPHLLPHLELTEIDRKRIAAKVDAYVLEHSTKLPAL